MRNLQSFGNKKLSVIVGLLITFLFSIILAGCNGSSEGNKAKAVPNVPDVAIFYVSGHDRVIGLPSLSYLEQPNSAGVAINNELHQSGYWVEEKYYVDDAFPVNNIGGYLALLKDLKEANEKWAKHGTKIILIAHSHGGVWLHSAVQKLSSIPVFCLVDLDASSFGWGTIGHSNQNDYISGDPRDKFYIPYASSDFSSEQTAYYDIEDVIFNNVKYAYEVRSGERVVGYISEYYDEKWNIRPDGTIKGLWRKFTHTSHKEVHNGYGSTISLVSQWLLNRLAE